LYISIAASPLAKKKQTDTNNGAGDTSLKQMAAKMSPMCRALSIEMHMIN